MANSEQIPIETQAQIATYVSDRIPDFSQRSSAMGNMGDLVTGQEVQLGSKKLPFVSRSKEDEGRVLTFQEVQAHIESEPRSIGYAVQERTRFLQDYRQFQTEVDGLKASISEPGYNKDHPQFLGEGSHAEVFIITQGGESYAVRTFFYKPAAAASVEDHVSAAMLAKGIPHVEHMVAASYIDEVTISELVPGMQLGELDTEHVSAITDEQLEELIDTCFLVDAAGIQLDTDNLSSNTLYDQKHGFGFVDIKDKKHTYNHSGLSSTFIRFATVFGTLRNNSDEAFLGLQKNLLERFGAITQRKVSPEIWQEVQPAVATFINVLSQ